MSLPEIQNMLDNFNPLPLEEMDNVRLMNRVDTKFVFSAGLMPVLIKKLSPNYKILEINRQRSFRYNTIYLDTEDFLFYNQHVTGKLARHKIRRRQYESTGGAFLEIKMKTNKNRTIKWRIRNDFPGRIIDENAASFLKKHVPYDPFFLQPVLMNRFTRVTLIGTGLSERLTFDYDMSFSTMSGESAELPFLAIVELKSERFCWQSPFIAAAKEAGIRPTGFSKYCVGNVLLKDVPRKNILKSKLLLLNKIENEYSKSSGS
jgi:hypothetical protein